MLKRLEDWWCLTFHAPFHFTRVKQWSTTRFNEYVWTSPKRKKRRECEYCGKSFPYNSKTGKLIRKSL